VGTGGDSHTRFPLGISFPAGSGLVAFAGAYGQMPVDIPESAYVEIDGELPDWADWRDVVNFINYRLKQEGRLVIKQVSRGKKKMEKSALSGKFLQIRYKGKSVFGIEEAWQIADKSAEQHVGGCYVILSPEAKLDWLKHERRWLQHQLDKKLARGEEAMRIAIEGLDADIAAIEANPEAFVFEDDTNIPAEQLHSEVVRIDLSQMSEPVLALPWEPQDAVLLSEVSGTEVDEVFIGSCMMDMQQIRAAAVIMEANPTLNVDTLKVVAPSIEEFNQLEVEGVMNILRACGAVIGLPGCHECMGNLPKVRLTEGCTGFSTGTRNFLNRMGKNTTVYEGSAWMAACVAILGRIPTFEEYLTMVQPALSKLVSIRQKMRFTDMMDEQLDQLTAIPA
jgi:aconitate hydratase 2/2-methylisocitrate dehydratase